MVTSSSSGDQRGAHMGVEMGGVDAGLKCPFDLRSHLDLRGLGDQR